jgi:CO/xanthine dehydrogenase FAD-binding subunit
MKPFDYLKPGSMNDAIGALKEHDHPVLLAGGTDLLVAMKSDAVKTTCLVDLKGIPGIDSIEYDNGFNIGPMATVREIETSPLIREKLPALSEAAATLGSIQIRNRATVGGNLCHGSPAADMAAILLAMDGEVSIASASGERRVKLEQFFTGPGSTAVGAAEVLVGIHIPEEVANYRGVYLKHGPRRAMDIGIVNIALLLDVDFTSGICNRIMLAMGAVGPTPLRAARAEEMLNGNRLTPELINQASEAASKEAQPITDFRASADYRRAMIVSLVSKGINQILASGSAC